MSREIDVTGVRQVIIDHFGSGSITIDRAAVENADDRVHGELDSSDSGYLDAAEIRQFNDQLRISMPRNLFGGADSHLQLSVPDGLSYLIGSGSADVRISAEAGRSKINSGSGDIDLATASDLSCTAGSGSIMVDRLTGRAGQLTTGSGDISINEATVPVQARAASGGVTIKNLSGYLRASSASGDISVPATSASVDLRTASGSLEIGVADGLPAWLDLSSVSGSIDIALDADHAPAEGEPYVTIRARSASGDIAIHRA